MTASLSLVVLTLAIGSPLLADDGGTILVRNPAPSATTAAPVATLTPVANLSADGIAAQVKAAEAARKAAPQDPTWAIRLGDLHLAAARLNPDPDWKYAEASKALYHYEAALKLTPIKSDQLAFEPGLAWSAYYVDRTDKVEMYTEAMFKGVHAGDPGFADAQHEGHTLLGLLALDKNDVKTAREELAASAEIRRSPRIDAIGPCLVLARRLLAKGEKDAVLDYLEACGKFWKRGADRLAAWTASIKKNEPCSFAGARAD